MSALHLHSALVSLIEIHGSAALVEALRDACHAAADHTATIGDRVNPISERWQMAGDTLSLVAQDIEAVELADGIDLADALAVLDEMSTVAA